MEKGYSSFRAKLHRHQESLLQALENSQSTLLNANEIRVLIEEMHTYQLELETQNEEMHRLQEQHDHIRQQYNQLFDGSNVGFMVLDSNGNILQANRITHKLLSDLTLDGIRETNFIKYIAPEDQAYFQLRYGTFFSSPENLELSVKLKSTSNHHQPLYMRLLGNQQLEQNQLLVTLIDISKEMLEIQTLNDNLHRECLTGVLNRNFILELLQAEIEKTQRDQKYRACLVIDIDNHAYISHLYGRLQGESFLKHIAEKLMQLADTHMHIGCTGSNSFIMLSQDAYPTIKECASHVDAFAKTIIEGFQEALPLTTHLQIPAEPLIGAVVIQPEAKQSMNSILTLADHCISEAKLRKSGYQLYFE